ncbi:hypothetical protein Tco_1161450, partial [Tanacetum coccineum]
LQRDPEAPALSLIIQDLLYLKKGNSGPEKIGLSLHKFPAIVFNNDDIEERTSIWVNKCINKFNPYARYGVENWKNLHVKIFYIRKNLHAKIFYIRRQKEPGRPKEEIYSNSKIVQVIKTYWELGHEHKFITEIVARRANDCIVSITKPDYKNLNKNDIEDMYLLIVNNKKINLTAPTITFPGIEEYDVFSIVYEPVHGIIYTNSKKEKRVMRHSEIHKFYDATLRRMLKGLKSYNNDVKYGYVQNELINDEVEFLKLFEEEIEIGIKSQGYRELDIVMSDSEDSTVTYTAVSCPYGGLSDIGSSGVDGPPVMPEDPYAYVVAAFQAPPSPNYVTGPEYPPLPEFVPKPVYPEFMPPDDDVLPAEEQLLPTVEDDDEDLEEDLADYPTDRDDDEEEEEEPFGDEAGDEEEEEHLALADFIAVPFPAVDHVPSVEETEPFKTDESVATPPPHPAYRITVRISIRAQTPVSLPSDTEVARLLAIPTPPPSPLSLWSSPLPQIPSPPLPVSSPVHVSPPPLLAGPTYPLGYRAAIIRLRVETPSTSHPLPSSIPPSGIPPLLPIPLPTPSPPLLLPSTVCRAGTSEVTLPPRKRLCIALGLRYNIGDSSFIPTAKPTGGFRADYGFVSTLDDEIRRDPERYVGYGITDTWKDMVEDIHGILVVIDMAKLSQRMTNFVMTVRQDTDKIYGRLDDAQDERTKDYYIGTADRDCSLASSRPRLTSTACGDTKTDEYTTDIVRDADRSMNGDDSHNSGTGVRRNERDARECTYPDFMKYQPLNFKGTEGVVELTQWFEKMETVFSISNCSVENQIKFSTCTLLGSSLTWWNSHVRNVGHDVAYAMTWTNLKKKMTDKYCPRTKIKKLKDEL